MDKLGELMVELRNNTVFQPLMEQIQTTRWSYDLYAMT